MEWYAGIVPPRVASCPLCGGTLGITIEAAEQDVPGVNCWTPMEIDLDCTDCYSYPNHDPIAWNEMIGDVLKWMRENMIWVESVEDGVAQCDD